MKYLCLVYGEESDIAGLDDKKCLDFDQAIRGSGHCVASEALQPVSTATTVRVRNGRVQVTDGPFSETKEVLGGYYMLEADNLDRALEVAARIPAARMGGAIEVRPLVER